MDLHPLFVHFPIAFLAAYTVFELIRWKKLLDKVYWFYIKAIMLIIGVVGAFIALGTGNNAAEALRSGSQHALVRTHSFWAYTSTYIFAFLALCYILVWLNKEDVVKSNKFHKMWFNILNITSYVLNRWPIIILAMIGLISIMITGALGASLVYGPDIDFVVSFIYHLFYA